jgi:hypothetical protein
MMRVSCFLSWFSKDLYQAVGLYFERCHAVGGVQARSVGSRNSASSSYHGLCGSVSEMIMSLRSVLSLACSLVRMLVSVVCGQMFF